MTPENESFLDAQALVGITQRTAQLRATEEAWEKAIIRARRRGLPVRAIAEAAGISPQSVLNVVARSRFNDADG